MSLLLILVAVWLAPAFIVGLLLLWHVTKADSDAPEVSDAPPAE